MNPLIQLKTITPHLLITLTLLCFGLLPNAQAVVPAPGPRPVGIAIAKSNDHVYAWFDDGKATSGTSDDFDVYRTAYSYQLPPGKTPKDILAMSISKSDRVYTWYDDSTVSIGTSAKLDAHAAPKPFTLPPGKAIDGIAGIGIAGSNDHVYVWYRDGTASSGTSTNLDAYKSPYAYSLPPGLSYPDLRELDIAGNDRVYAWFRTGVASSGNSADLDAHRAPYGYLASHVIYRWWGPGPQRFTGDVGKLADLLKRVEDVDRRLQAAGVWEYRIEHAHSGDIPAVSRGTTGQGMTPVAEADTGLIDASQPELEVQQLAFDSPISGSIDPMLAVGHNFIIASDTGSIAFLDKNGQQLAVQNGIPTSMSTGKFFSGFLADTNADGSFNDANINRHLGFSKPCDSTDYPETNGNRFCIVSFYDTRVLYDAPSRRFFVISNSRHPLWVTTKYGGCGIYTVPVASVSDPNDCAEVKDGKCIMATTEFCDLARRYVALAVSKSEDPRDGFHQYMVTQNIYRDWPWLEVNGSHVVVSHSGDEDQKSPVATVFDRSALGSGVQHPPFFRYLKGDVDGNASVLPLRHFGDTQGLSFLTGSSGSSVKVFGIPTASDPWKAPALLKASLPLSGGLPGRNAAVYRNGKLHYVGHKEVEVNENESRRYSVRVVRVPVSRNGNQLTLSKSTGAGYLDHFFGRNAAQDAPGDRVSYEKPVVAVNKDGDMLFGFGRFPFETAQPLFPEARSAIWYAGEAKQRRSRLLRAGTGTGTPGETIASALDYTTATVDPADDETFWVALPYATGSGYGTVLGRIKR